MSRRPSDLRPSSQRPNGNQRGPLPGGLGFPRWVLWAVLALILVLVLAPTFFSSKGGNDIPYTEFRQEVADKKIRDVTIAQDGRIDGTRSDGTKFTSTAPPQQVADTDLTKLMQDN